MTAAVLVVFVMGLRHGADPDHLAAIDNLTRNVHDRMPHASRFVGALFAVGHSAMVLLLAASVAVLGSRIVHPGVAFERAAGIASITMLLILAVCNIITVMRTGKPMLRMRLLPAVLRNATNPLVAVPIGALFGLGFETSSQLIAYGVAFSSAHFIEGLVIGAAFCLGMICTDTFDSLFVARAISTQTKGAARVRQTWIIVVTLVALGVAAEKLVELLGYPPPLDELTLSGMTVLVLACTALIVSARRISSS